jgi:hypothetical protein
MKVPEVSKEMKIIPQKKRAICSLFYKMKKTSTQDVFDAFVAGTV